MRRLLALLVLVTALDGSRAMAGTTDDQKAIGLLLHRMFDKPNATMTVEPIVVAGDSAIADWAQDQMGGRAVLRRKQGAWTLILCAGDAIRSQEALTKVGVPADDARRLAGDLAAAEARLPSERVAMFSRFEGLVMMDGSGGETQHRH